VTLYKVLWWQLPGDSPSISIRIVRALTEIQTKHLPNTIQFAWYLLQMNRQINEEMKEWIDKK